MPMQEPLTILIFMLCRPDELKATIYHLMTAVIEEKELPDRSEYIKSFGNLDLIPCSIELSAMEVNLVNVMSREIILKSVLEELKLFYEIIIIDCMPSLGMLTINALAACDSVLVPATPQYLSAKGLELLLKTIARVKKRINPAIEIDGILITMFNERTRLSKEIMTLITEAYGEHIRIFESKIPVSVKVGEATLNYKSIVEYDPDGKVATAYKSFAKEYDGI
ncbi:MAG: ParA family protein [Ruminiclostridium sp.]|nr:ParA family protein [Ruminiclostridium sp.]